MGPGNYNFDSFTDQMSKKVTSLRGPYDLFSGDRNKPMKTGHFAAPVSSFRTICRLVTVFPRLDTLMLQPRRLIEEIQYIIILVNDLYCVDLIIRFIYLLGVLTFQNNSNLGPGQYEIKSFAEELTNEHTKKLGKFGKVNQYPETPTERIYAFSLSQNPRNSVSSLTLFLDLIFIKEYVIISLRETLLIERSFLL